MTIRPAARRILAKIALDLEHALARRARDAALGATARRVLGSGQGWSVADVLCTCGPGDRAFEERHDAFCIALVVAGAFEYRSETGHALMTPGAVMLGNVGERFECGHRHRAGDRCVAFHYRPEYVERLFADVGGVGRNPSFPAARIAPSRGLASFVAAACTRVTATCTEVSTMCNDTFTAPRGETTGRGMSGMAWDEMALALASRVLRHVEGAQPSDARPIARAALKRVIDTLQWIDEAPDAELGVERLAGQAGLSPYHFLRTFERATGVTPHQYVLRARLRAAAQRLADAPEKIIDVALDCGFADLSNFNRAFRAEFGVNPRAYRLTWRA